jgi:hypothetical protein
MEVGDFCDSGFGSGRAWTRRIGFSAYISIETPGWQIESKAEAPSHGSALSSISRGRQFTPDKTGIRRLIIVEEMESGTDAVSGRAVARRGGDGEAARCEACLPDFAAGCEKLEEVDERTLRSERAEAEAKARGDGDTRRPETILFGHAGSSFAFPAKQNRRGFLAGL